MAEFHLRVKNISRGSGGSAVEGSAYRSGGVVTGSALKASAYRAGESLTHTTEGKTHDYSRKSDVLGSEIITPNSAPDWSKDRQTLWNTVESLEKRKDSRLAREVEVMLPRELTHDQHKELVRSFVHDEFISKGFLCDIAYHCHEATDGQAHPHAHILIPTRTIDDNGFSKLKPTEWNKRDTVELWRKNWAGAVNSALEQYGHDVRIDHRTLKAQGIDKTPQAVRGKISNELYRKGQSFTPSAHIARDTRNHTIAHEMLKLGSVIAKSYGVRLPPDFDKIYHTEPRHNPINKPVTHQVFNSMMHHNTPHFNAFDALFYQMAVQWNIYAINALDRTVEPHLKPPEHELGIEI